MRTFAIIQKNKDINVVENIISRLNKDEDVIVFSVGDIFVPENVKCVKIQEEEYNNDPKIRNFVAKYFFDKNYKGFLHIIEDKVEILKDTTSFLDEIENMMVKLNQKTWFNTITDPCNYTFTIYNPRFSINIDEPSVIDKYNKNILWTSHANLSWVCFNYQNLEFSDVELDEKFSIAMYYIIKFLSERRNNKKCGELYYMNFYPTIQEEKGVFRLMKYNDKKSENTELMNKEGEIFNSMNINHTADMNIEEVIEDLYNLLKNS